MSYQEAMEAAGAKIHDFTEFGSYQGTWLALVTFEGQTGWIEGGYGSCYGCDAFESEFSYSERAELGETNWRTNQPFTQEDVDAYQKKLADFGRSYLTGGFATIEEKLNEYRKKCAEEYAYSDDKEILAYLESRTSEVN